MPKIYSIRKVFFCEFAATAIFILGGLNTIIVFNVPGGWLVEHIHSFVIRQVIAGFLFGTIACFLALSVFGKISGTHINPAVSIAFWLKGKLAFGPMLLYVLAQFTGAIVGGLPAIFWGANAHFCATVPGRQGVIVAFVAETITTAILIAILFLFAGNKKIRYYTPFVIPIFYAVLNGVIPTLSGCSTNPARSLGSACATGIYDSIWLYMIAPPLGALLMTQIFRWTRSHEYLHIKHARISYHDHPLPVN